ncbi:MAG: DUF192 domain-containing protein [Candidatus Diapherotrites archaeon]|nr:DUF192 domain-containing protein [Candidatus Diapherotrites archaeon]
MLRNLTQGQVLMERVRFARTFREQMKGLMGERRERFDYALVFDRDRERLEGSSIHMLFVSFPIDVLFLNEKREVVDVVNGLKPWTLYYQPRQPARYIVELPEGKGGKVKEGDQLTW